MTEQHTPPNEPKTTTRCSAAGWWTLLIVLLLLIVGVLVFPFTGLYNIAASSGHSGFGKWYLNTLMEHSVQARAKSVTVPADLTSQDRIRTGFEHYDSMCVVCHGAPGVPRDAIGQGITPLPPMLGEEAAEWTPQQIFWILHHGVKMAGMPAFGQSHSEHDLWALTAFVNQLPEISAQQYQQMKSTLSDGSSEHQHSGQESSASSGGQDQSQGSSGNPSAEQPDSHEHQEGSE